MWVDLSNCRTGGLLVCRSPGFLASSTQPANNERHAVSAAVGFTGTHWTKTYPLPVCWLDGAIRRDARRKRPSDAPSTLVEAGFDLLAEEPQRVHHPVLR